MTMAPPSSPLARRFSRIGLGPFVFTISSLFLLLGFCIYVGFNLIHVAFAVFVFLVLLWAIRTGAILLLIYTDMALLYLVIMPAIQQVTGVGYRGSSTSVGAMTVGLFAFVSIHFVALLIGHMAMPRTKMVISLHKHSARANLFLPLLILFAIEISAIFLVGIDRVFLPRRAQDELVYLAESSSYILFLTQITKLLPAFMTLMWLGNVDMTRKQWYISPAFFFLVINQLVISNPVNTARFVSLSGMLMVAFCIIIKMQRNRLLIWSVVIAPYLALIALPVTTSLRTGWGGFSWLGVWKSFSSLEFSVYTMLNGGMSIEHFESANYTVSQLFIFFPRSIWTSKSESIGGEIAEKLDYVFSNVAMPSAFSSYADYGFAGLVVFSFGLGCLMKRAVISRMLCDFKERKFIYSLVLLCMMPIVFRGDLSTAMIALYASVVAYEICRIISRLRLRKTAV